MSSLQFDRATSKGSGLFESRNCCNPHCNGAGRWRWWVQGVMCGYLCGKHRNEMVKTWDACSGVTERKAVAA